MKIAIDFREGANPFRAGKGEYVYQLVQAWFNQYPDDEVILLVEAGQTPSLSFGKWRLKVVPAKGLWWHLWVWLWLEFTRPVNVYFSTTSLIVPALVRSVKTVTTLFDFTVWRFPTTHFPKAVMVEKIFMGWAIRFSNHLLAISEFTKQEAIQLFRTAVDKITVTPLGVDPHFQPMSPSPTAIRSLQEKYQLPENFILYLGTLEPRKNIARLIEAFQTIRLQHPDTYLVLAGAKGWSDDILPSPPPPQIVVTGYIDDHDRPTLYNLATMFVFPSLYEGFGMPPLEAMACGVPVITAAVASLPEVVGESAVLINPTDTRQLAQSINKLLGNKDLRIQLRQQGLAQAKQFTWEATLAHTRQAIYNYD
ncbi:MAG: glycosyltransferase family 1 protein [Patescibacteria group bacterium]